MPGSELEKLEAIIEAARGVGTALASDFGENERATGYGMALTWVMNMIEGIKDERTENRTQNIIDKFCKHEPDTSMSELGNEKYKCKKCGEFYR